MTLGDAIATIFYVMGLMAAALLFMVLVFGIVLGLGALGHLLFSLA
jgi:hypothetical protein